MKHMVAACGMLMDRWRVWQFDLRQFFKALDSDSLFLCPVFSFAKGSHEFSTGLHDGLYGAVFWLQ